MDPGSKPEINFDDFSALMSKLSLVENWKAVFAVSLSVRVFVFSPLWVALYLFHRVVALLV